MDRAEEDMESFLKRYREKGKFLEKELIIKMLG